jgi:hypothetical protein
MLGHGVSHCALLRNHAVWVPDSRSFPSRRDAPLGLACPGRQWRIIQFRMSNSQRGCDRAFSRRVSRPSLARTSALEGRGRREGWVSTDTHGPRATKKARGGHHRLSRKHPAFPAQWFYGLYVLSPGTGLSCPRHARALDQSLSRAWPQRREARTTRFRRPRSRHSSAQGLRADVIASIASRFQRS